MLMVSLDQVLRLRPSLPVPILRMLFSITRCFCCCSENPSQDLSGINMINALVKTPSLLGTRALYKCTLPKHPPRRHPLMDRVPSGLRYTLLVFSVSLLKNGPLMLSMPPVVCSTLRSSSKFHMAVSGKHSVVIPSSLPAGQYLLRAEIVSQRSLQPPNVMTNMTTDCPSCSFNLPWCSILHW